MSSPLRRGLVAGAAGTTALNLVTWADMAWRGRAPSGVPAQVAERLAELAGISVRGTGAERAHRLEGWGELSGIATGLGVGVVASLARAAGIAPPALLGSVLIGGAAQAASDLTAAALGVTDPRSWTDADWVSDLVPHLAYGVVTAGVLAGYDRHEQRTGSQLRTPRVSPLPLRAAALGLAAGGRSASPFAALALATPAKRGRLPLLSGALGTIGATAASAGELVADKLPATPSRLEPPVLGGRIGSGALAGALLARREQRGAAATAFSAVLGAGGALAGSYAGAAWRSASAGRRPDWQSALVEDAVVVLLNTFAVRPLPAVSPLSGRERADLTTV